MQTSLKHGLKLILHSPITPVSGTNQSTWEVHLPFLPAPSDLIHNFCLLFRHFGARRDAATISQSDEERREAADTTPPPPFVCRMSDHWREGAYPVQGVNPSLPCALFSFYIRYSER